MDVTDSVMTSSKIDRGKDENSPLPVKRRGLLLAEMVEMAEEVLISRLLGKGYKGIKCVEISA